MNANPMTFSSLLYAFDRQGVRLRIGGEGRLQVARLPPRLRPAFEAHHDRLTALVRGERAVLEPAQVRWADPPCASNWYAWAEGHPKRGESPPRGIQPAPWTARPAKETPPPYFGFAGEEVRRHVLWLCRTAGTGEEALPGAMTTAPFTLRPGCRVEDPVRCVGQLRADVVDGPGGPRSRTGALQEDLRRLYQMFAREPSPQIAMKTGE